MKEIGNLSPQAIQTLTEDYTAQINQLQSQLANIDIAEVSKVKSSIDSFSISIQELQTKINTQLQKISIDQPSLQKSIQVQIQQAIANQSKPIESSIAMLITEKLDTQKRHTCWVGDLDWTAESFNRFIYGLSNRYKRQYHQSTTTGDSAEFRINHRPNQYLKRLQR